MKKFFSIAILLIIISSILIIAVDPVKILFESMRFELEWEQDSISNEQSPKNIINKAIFVEEVEKIKKTLEKNKKLNKKETIRYITKLKTKYSPLEGLEYLVIDKPGIEWKEGEKSFLGYSGDTDLLVILTGQTANELERLLLSRYCSYVWGNLSETTKLQWRVSYTKNGGFYSFVPEFLVWCKQDLQGKSYNEGLYNKNVHPFNNDTSSAYDGYLD